MFGHIPGVGTGTLFASRAEVKAAGLHRDRMAGISYAPGSAAEAIVISGGYEDDRDSGDAILYTGQGGNSLETGRQIGNQALRRGNLALARSCLEGLPVRVIRGARGDPPHAPPFGYRYDGLYYVTGFRPDVGTSGHVIWRFYLVAADTWNDSGSVEASRAVAEEDSPYETAPRQEQTVQRIIRNSAVAMTVKKVHDYRCQLCDTKVRTLAGPYAEGAHIRPLGAPHDGPDIAGNLLCLCPNCHVRFDFGAITVERDLTVSETTEVGVRIPIGKVRTHPQHVLDRACIEYHRAMFTLSLKQDADDP